ncbi:glycerate kinase [Pseudarthrobacter sp. fls2-241-R2A-168]|uniref:glycerate kinase n=1 Tax=Pseudarthrobacter sp. fls2-241-R2A-168 TaxID=3040304 RepID=UPI002556EDAA|nr:glycerate kinase [Pseudarthrobacter sp. fls2-241-R2A-168]
MRVIIAPDSFKGTITAAAAAAAIATGWHDVRPEDDLLRIPMADGGEGTLAAVESAVPGAERVSVEVLGPATGANPQASTHLADWLRLPARDGYGPVGVIELAAASGIEHLSSLAPLTAHTYGFGQLIHHALKSGISRILLAIGSSASTDGGTGALKALGARFIDRNANLLPLGGGFLPDLEFVDFRDLLSPPPGGAVVLSDVTNPLLGPQGAACIFGPQKGADDQEISHLEKGLETLASKIGKDPNFPGAGAAGGTGYGLARWGAEIRPGAAEIADIIGLTNAVKDAHLIITGEGRFDNQSRQGKVTGYVAGLAAQAQIPVALVAGAIEGKTSDYTCPTSLSQLAQSIQAAKNNPQRWLEEAGRILASQWAPSNQTQCGDFD